MKSRTIGAALSFLATSACGGTVSLGGPIEGGTAPVAVGGDGGDGGYGGGGSGAGGYGIDDGGTGGAVQQGGYGGGVAATDSGDSGRRQQAGNCPLVPPVDAGVPQTGCTIVGSWRLNSSHGNVQSSGDIDFGADGSYYGGPPGTDLSKTYSYDGAYSIDGQGPDGAVSRGSIFNLLFSCGDGCVGSGTFDLQFESGCAIALLNETVTACTGNRLALAGQVVLTRR